MDYELRKECPHYKEEHDMGATIPICRKDGSVCDGCQKINLIPRRGMSHMVLLLFLLTCAGSIGNQELLSEPPKPSEKEENDNNGCDS